MNFRENGKCSARRAASGSRLRTIGRLLTIFSASLLLSACPPPGSLPFTTTVTGIVKDQGLNTGLPGVKISAVTAPANPANQPVTSGAGGGFTLQVRHSGTFSLALENSCYNPVTTPAVSASEDGSRSVGVISLKPKPEPTGADRYTFTPKGNGPASERKFKLTVNCVREIKINEFSADSKIITDKARELGRKISPSFGDVFLISEISLPSTLTEIGSKAFNNHFSLSGTLTIPGNVKTIGYRAFWGIGFDYAAKENSASAPMVAFESGSMLETIGDSAFESATLRDFMFPDNLKTIEQKAFVSADFYFSRDAPKTLIIPANVQKIENNAFASLTSSPPAGASKGITAVDIRSDKLAKPDGASASAFPLQPNIFQYISGITKITLPRAVYDSYTKKELQAVFGSTFTNYRKPDGTAYTFASKP